MSPLIDDDDDRETASLAVEEDIEKPESRVGDETSEDESDSDEEEGEVTNRNGKSVKDILEDVLKGIRDGKRDLTNSSQLKAFKANGGDGNTLASNTGDPRQPTALHIMAAMEKKDLKLDSKMEPLVKYLVEHENDLLRSQDRSGHTPLFLAIEAKKEKMVQWMCDSHSNISAILAISSNDKDKMNCLHIGIDKRVKFLDLLIDRAEPETLAAKDGDGNTALHLAVEYKKCKKEQLDIIQKIIAKSDVAVQHYSENGDFNDDGLSPYLHHKESVRKALAKEKEKEKKKAKEEKEREKSNARLRPDGGETDNSAQNRETAPKSQASGGPGGAGAPSVQVSDPNGRPDKRPNIQIDPSRTKYGGRSQPAANLNSPAVGTAPPLANKDEMKKILLRAPETAIVKPAADARSVTDSGHKSSKIDEATLKGVERLLKLHYLRSRSYNAALEILYGRNTTSDYELYFDLSGHANIAQTGFENLLSKLKFEDILQYVAIPRLNVEVNMNAANSKRPRNGRSPKQDGDGRRDLCYIFDRLRKRGVKTILKVIIDDSVSPAHSDEAIEDALKFMDVEIWDWKRIDLCSEVICRVASKAREVNLYWSGNNAVLRGWSEEGGLKRLRELKTVHLHIQQGLETNSRTKQNVEDFCDRMKKLCPEVDVHKEWPIIQREQLDANALLAGEQEHSTKHEWIQCMKEFRRLLFDAERYYDRGKVEEIIEEPIKVALIDDGVDVKDLEFSFIGGRTFCTRDEEHNLNDPYYVSSTGHGTIMAKQIHLLCPRAQFYILRLEDHASEEGSRQLTARSAAQAIMAAVRKKVHIISMSWTIDPPEDEEERRLLDAAIVEAANADILMFCSASDKGAKQNATYPSKATTKIFTIGAATASGAADPWVGNLGNINFTFPGTKVEMDGPRNGTDTSSREVTGSSVATALAAGLAALVLYCVQVRLLLATDQDKQKARRDFHLLKKHDYMMKALKDIGTTEESNHKFIEVWEVFGKKVEEKERYDQDRWLDLVAEVGTILCRKIG
ncbi:hypothetical protein V8C35DRAFT_213161 [Trichoderma chlorosporum]